MLSRLITSGFIQPPQRGCKMAFMPLTDIRQPDILHNSPGWWRPGCHSMN